MEGDAGTGPLGAFRGMVLPARLGALMSAMGTSQQGGEGK